MSKADLSQQHAVPDPANALPTNTLVDQTEGLSRAGQSGLGGGGEEDLKESARRQVEAALKQSQGGTSIARRAGTTDLQQQHVIPDTTTALPTNTLVDETSKLASAGSSGLGGSNVQTVGNTSASFTPKTASDHNKSAHGLAAVDDGPKVALEGGAGPTLADQIPEGVKEAYGQASNVVAEQVTAAKEGIEHAFGKNDTITPGRELPGGWGPTPPASTTGPDATTTIYQDISSALDKVGQAAYNAVPASFIEKLHPSPASSPIKTTTNTVPHQQPQHPTTTEDIGAAVKDGVAVAQENAKIAADKAVELAKDAYNSITGGQAADPAKIIPHSRDATSGSSLATTELPTLKDMKEELSHAVDDVKEMLGLAPAANGSHEVKAVDKGPKVDLLSSAHEVAPVASGQSTASATRGDVTPSQIESTPLAGGGGLAAGIADDVADAARHSSATTVGDAAPGGREDPRAGAGGLAATIADDVADAAKESTATTVGSSSTGPQQQSALAGGGGLAAAIANDVARAAEESPATSVGATGANAIPVAEGHHASETSPAKDTSKAIPELRETSHSPAALQPGAVPTSSTGPTSVLAGGAADNGAPSSSSADDKKAVESDGPHGLIKTASGYKHRHDLTPEELAAHDKTAPDAGDKGSSTPPHRDIDTTSSPLSPAKSSHSDSTTASGHKKKMSIGEKIKTKLHIGDKH